MTANRAIALVVLVDATANRAHRMAANIRTADEQRRASEAAALDERRQRDTRDRIVRLVFVVGSIVAYLFLVGVWNAVVASVLCVVIPFAWVWFVEEFLMARRSLPDALEHKQFAMSAGGFAVGCVFVVVGAFQDGSASGGNPVWPPLLALTAFAGYELVRAVRESSGTAP